MDIFIIRDGQQTGPFNENTVQSLLRDGGLRPKDMAWRKGLANWVPVSDLLNHGNGNGASKPVEASAPVQKTPPPAPAKPASAKQKALLKYLGATMEEGITRDEAALAISDALENPKLQSRLAKWHEEKLRMHPEIYQDELDFRRANRVSRYLELCETEGAGVVKDVTKAHVQVLLESLDKKQSSWESDSRSPLWDWLLPSVAEHFPKLVKEEWKGRLKYGGPSKVVESIAKTSDMLTPSPATPGPFAAAIRGVIYGAGILAVAIGGHYLYKNSQQPEQKPAPAVADNKALTEPPVPAPAAPAPAEEKPENIPLIGAAEPPAPPAPNDPPAPEPAVAAAPPPAEPPMDEKKPEPPAPAPPPAAMTNIPAFTPAPAPGEKPMEAPVAPGVTAPPPAAPKTVATLRQAIAVTLPNGSVTLPAGTGLRILGYSGQNIRVAWNNSVFNVPMSATDVNESAALAAPPPSAPPPAAPPAPRPMPAAPKKPADPLSDL